MDPQITSFINSLNVAPTQTQALEQLLNTDSNLTSFLEGKPFDDAALTSSACSVLHLLLGRDKVLTEGVSEAIMHRNWSQTCQQSPTAILTPTQNTDIALALQTFRFFSTRFAVVSGGHSPNPGFAAVGQPGVLIDLKKLNGVSVSTERKTASIGPGARWGEVYEVLDKYKVSVVGGRVHGVGVGGLVLGGGLFHFSGEYGLAADNVKNFEVVLADGSIINANSHENTDLFWALKGGGSNFGIVTKFEMHTIPVHDIWYTVSIYSPSDADACLDAFAAWQQHCSSDLKSTVALIIGLESVTLGLLYSTPNPLPAVFAPFDTLPAPVFLAVPPSTGTVHGLMQLLASNFSSTPMRHDYRGISFRIDAQLYKDVYNAWKEKAAAVHASTGATMTFVLQPIPAGLAAAGEARGGNPLGIPQENHTWWTTLVDWTQSSDDTTVRAVPIATTQLWKQLSGERGLDVDFVYMNDAARDQDPIPSYGKENVRRLREVAKRYDPGEVFQKLQCGGFLLGDE